jgi:hypothetical protein
MTEELHRHQRRPSGKASPMAGTPRPAEGRYDWFGLQEDSAAVELVEARLTETHEYFHHL